MRHSRVVIISLVLSVTLIGGFIAYAERASLVVWLAPSKAPSLGSEQSDRAKAANLQFWEALHGGKYDQIGEVLNALTAAYLETPRDSETAAHIGFSHIWRFSEAARLGAVSPSATDDIALARRYFDEAVRLAPDDQRYRGFKASMEMAEASLHGDEKLSRLGYFNMKDAIKGWPEFNLFTAGYVMSRLPFDHAKYEEAVDLQWQNFDVCAEEKIDRQTGDFSKYMAKETTTGPKRACWNSWIAPHNFEGFNLNMGDMLVKQGKPEIARRVYANAKLSKTYSQWPFKYLIDERIAQAEENVSRFRSTERGPVTTTMISTGFSCMGCHQK